MLITPLLLSPMALRHQAARGLASVGVVFSPSFAGEGGLSLLHGDSEFQASYQHFSQIFGQAALGYLAGLQAVRESQGLKGSIFVESQAIKISPFDLNSSNGFFQTATWQSFSDRGNIIFGNALGNKIGPAYVPIAQPQTRFATAK